jgi:chromosome transmission fidelity protein 1
MHPSSPKFNHPYQPYDIQLSFMISLYDCIEHGKVGIFESPTGTGKSLSLICGSLTWLRDNQRRAFETDLDVSADDGSDWLVRAENDSRRREILREREELEQRLAKIRHEEARKRGRLAEGREHKKAKQTHGQDDPKDDEEQFMLDDYESDGEVTQSNLKPSDGLSITTQALLERLKAPTSAREEALEINETKIIFCSRTHSQLTQFVHELQRVSPPPGLLVEKTDVSQGSESGEAVKHLSLGSRKNLCINEKVSRLPSTAAINDRCLELQKSGTAKDRKCGYLPNKDNRDVVDSFRDRAIATVRDIEDIAKLGKALHICPYYASRPAIAPSEVLTLPYPLLLQKSAREALGVSVKDNIVVIDEAHNLMDAIADTMSISLRLSQLQIANQQVTAYVQRFKNKLKGKNRVYVTQIIRLLNSVVDCLQTTAKSIRQQDVSVTGMQLMSGKGVDQVKPHKLLQYLHESKLAHKVEGYIDARPDGNKNRGVLMQFQNFLTALMNPAAEGRFFISRQAGEVLVRYTLLDPREHFRDVVEEARAVILAGGTMSPMSDYADYLFSYLPQGRLETFSFGHVIPKENIYVGVIAKGTGGLEFDFTFGKRSKYAMIVELGQVLLEISQTIPDGVVVFFPSYEYLRQVIEVWKSGQQGIFESLGKQKRIFEEAKGVSVDDLLRDYARAIDTGHGGLMLSVVGGSLSEGINFSDRLGRAVIAVGLPFPNANSAEWRAKVEHVEATKLKQCQEEQHLSEPEARANAKAAGRDFYENACMRAVNQSIGRAIRHRKDYAAILLVDRRFTTDRIRNKLPGWIRRSMSNDSSSKSWAATERDLKDFFSTKIRFE